MVQLDRDSREKVIKALAVEEGLFIEGRGPMRQMATKGEVSYERVIDGMGRDFSAQERLVLEEGLRMIVENGADAKQLGRAQEPYFKHFLDTTDGGQMGLMEYLANGAAKRGIRLDFPGTDYRPVPAAEVAGPRRQKELAPAPEMEPIRKNPPQPREKQLAPVPAEEAPAPRIKQLASVPADDMPGRREKQLAPVPDMEPIQKNPQPAVMPDVQTARRFVEEVGGAVAPPEVLKGLGQVPGAVMDSLRPLPTPPGQPAASGPEKMSR